MRPAELFLKANTKNFYVHVEYSLAESAIFHPTSTGGYRNRYWVLIGGYPGSIGVTGRVLCEVLGGSAHCGDVSCDVRCDIDGCHVYGVISVLSGDISALSRNISTLSGSTQPYRELSQPYRGLSKTTQSPLFASFGVSFALSAPLPGVYWDHREQDPG